MVSTWVMGGVVVAGMLLLAACGGGGDGDDETAPTTEQTTTTESDDTTTTVAEEPAFEASTIAAGDQHACALDPDGRGVLLGLQPHGAARGRQR